jgi:peroxiredoxin Q/BCP
VRTDADEALTLSALRGTPVVLYFYPKDDTSGCTTQACEFRDLFPRFDGGQAVVLGVSPDSVKSHVKFKEKYQLPFTLLADTEHAVAEAYGVWREKSSTAASTWASSAPPSSSTATAASRGCSRR